jgi:hypothetical protein
MPIARALLRGKRLTKGDGSRQDGESGLVASETREGG